MVATSFGSATGACGAADAGGVCEGLAGGNIDGAPGAGADGGGGGDVGACAKAVIIKPTVRTKNGREGNSGDYSKIIHLCSRLDSDLK